MTDSEQFKIESKDPTQEIAIQIPHRLVKRIHTYVTKNNTTITNVVIEALDIFLREQENNSL